jgi:hypothetical protein
MGRVSTLFVAVLLAGCEPPRGAHDAGEPSSVLHRSAHTAVVLGRAATATPWTCQLTDGELIADGGLQRWPVSGGPFSIQLERGTHSLVLSALGGWSRSVSVTVRGGQQLDIGELTVPIALGALSGVARVERAEPQPAATVVFTGPCSGSVVSDDSGHYTIANLVPGLYELTMQDLTSTIEDVTRTSTLALVSPGETGEAQTMSVTGLGTVVGKVTIDRKAPGTAVVWVRASDGSNGYALVATDGSYILPTFAGAVTVHVGRGEHDEGALVVEVPYNGAVVAPSLDLPP